MFIFSKVWFYGTLVFVHLSTNFVLTKMYLGQILLIDNCVVHALSKGYKVDGEQIVNPKLQMNMCKYIYLLEFIQRNFYQVIIVPFPFLSIPNVLKGQIVVVGSCYDCLT